MLLSCAGRPSSGAVFVGDHIQAPKYLCHVRRQAAIFSPCLGLVLLLRVGRAWVNAFRDAPLIVSPSGSCVALVRRHLPGLLLPALAAQAREVAERAYELRRGGTPPSGIGAPKHPSCCLPRALGED
jgi:hypothetical protein